MVALGREVLGGGGGMQSKHVPAQPAPLFQPESGTADTPKRKQGTPFEQLVAGACQLRCTALTSGAGLAVGAPVVGGGVGGAGCARGSPRGVGELPGVAGHTYVRGGRHRARGTVHSVCKKNTHAQDMGEHVVLPGRVLDTADYFNFHGDGDELNPSFLGACTQRFAQQVEYVLIRGPVRYPGQRWCR